VNLYAILDLGYVRESEIVSCTKSLCKSGVSMLQLRAKSKTPKEILEIAKQIKPICKDLGTPFIINDYPEIAGEIEADGVHIGQEDGKINDAKKASANCRIIGRSTHNLDQVRAANNEGADYIGFGPLYATNTKPGRPAIGLNDITQAHKEFKGPIYCIGGVNERTIIDVIKAGARNVVIVSDLLQSSDIVYYVSKIKSLAKKTLEEIS
tara:strand:- start:1092 stop:1718 length:627 start_codon:yes stop_codon:yes gene_type:complete